ncbi:MAG: tripartite tricarboxylate transporter substrate binding protein [Burkholderiales bacterium]|nr:tripartite tricarboxylate transporter substrate binding protein [Burkholderiales bacterium]
MSLCSKAARVLAAAALTLAAAAMASAQSFPNRPVRIVVPFTAGSQTDITARLVAFKLTELWGQQVVVDNRGGAGGTVGTGIVADATPDGYTLLAHSSGYSIGPALYPKWKVNMVRDFQAITTLVSTPHVIVISPSLGPKTLKDFIEFGRKKGEGFTWSSAGVGSGTHFCGEIFMLAAKLKHTHIPYKGTPEALLDAITGRVNVFFSPLGAAVPFLKDGKALGLAVTSKARNPAVPNIPTVNEAGVPGFEVDLWFVLAAPAKTPQPAIEKIWTDTTAVLKMPEVVKAFAVTGVVTHPRTIAETQAFVASELKTYGEVARLANVPTF